jgi:adenosylhomocysteine nucleosidase
MDSGTGGPVLFSSISSKRIAFVAALELEARIPRLIDAARAPLVYTSGPGRERAFAAARDAIASGADVLISWGLAGGLSPDVGTGTVLLPVTIKNGAGEWRTDDAWRERLADALRPHLPVTDQALYTADRVLTTPAAKAELASRSGAAAVDMESSGLARAAAEAGLPFVVLRVVADGCDDVLPDEVESLVTADGRTRYRGLAAIVTSPRQIGLLAGLAKNSGRARAVLQQIISILDESGQ